MKTKFTMLIAIIMVLSGCTGGVEDAAEEIADVLTKGCMDETALNYDATAEETSNCVSKSVMTASLIDFLTIVEEGPGDLQAKFAADESLAATLTIDETFEGETVNMVGTFIVDGVNDGFSTSMTITDSSGTWTMNMHHVGEDLVIKWNDTSVRMKTVTTPLEFYLMDEGEDDDDGDDDDDGSDDGDDGPMIGMPESPENPMDNMEANNTTWSGMDGMTVSGTDSMGGVISATLDSSGAITSMSYSISEADTSGSDTTALNTISASMTLLSDTTITIDQSIELHSLPFLALSMDDMMGMFGPGDGGPDDDGPDVYSFSAMPAGSHDPTAATGESLVRVQMDDGVLEWDRLYVSIRINDGTPEECGTDATESGCYYTTEQGSGDSDTWSVGESIVIFEGTVGSYIQNCDSTCSVEVNLIRKGSGSTDDMMVASLTVMAGTMGSGGPDDGGPDDAPPAPEWWCSDEVGGTVNMSINWTMVNDGTEDCGDGSDEPQDFDADGTIDNWWHCADGTNITADMINDGTEDCAFGSDEGEMNRPESISILGAHTGPFDDTTLAYDLTINLENLIEGKNYTYEYEVWHMNTSLTTTPHLVSELIVGNGMGVASRALSISTSEWGQSTWTDDTCYHVHVSLANESGIPIGVHNGTDIAIGAADCSGGPGDGPGDGGEECPFDAGSESPCNASVCDDHESTECQDYVENYCENTNPSDSGCDMNEAGNNDDGMMAEGTYLIIGLDHEGALADYEAVLSQCTEADADNQSVCVDTNISMVLSAAPSPDSPITFVDSDESGTLSSEDLIMVNASLVTEDYNTVRLKYIPADKYSDENPLVLPGFTAGFSLMAMLGAALLLRRD